MTLGAAMVSQQFTLCTQLGTTLWETPPTL
jgi:hypothetical protein